MKIIFLADIYPPDSRGGGELSTHILAKAFKEQGHDLLVITITQDKGADGSMVNYEGVDVMYIHSHASHKLRYYYSLYNSKVLKRLETIFREYRPDVIHGQIINTHFSYYSLVIARRFCQHVFFTARDTMPFTYGKFWWFANIDPGKLNYKVRFIDLIKQAKKAYVPFHNHITRYWFNKYCTGILAVSKELAKAYTANGYKNVSVVYNSVDTSLYERISEEEISDFKNNRSLTGKKIIFFSGRLSPLKGLFPALNSLSIVCRKFPEAMLVIAAKEQFDHKIMAYIKKLNIEKNILQLGWLDQERMRVVFKAADICIIPSIYLDPLPRIAYEAMASRKPVVGTSYGGTPEVVEDGVSGFIVNPLDTVTLADKIADLLRDPEKAKQFGEAGYKKISENFTPNIQVKKTLEFYLR